MAAAAGTHGAACEPEDGPYPHWHVPGFCHNSARGRGHGALRAHAITNLGWPVSLLDLGRHEQRAAEYWWLAPNGYWFAMCAECCAIDRQIAEEEPDLAPIRITSVRTAARSHPAEGHAYRLTINLYRCKHQAR